MHAWLAAAERQATQVDARGLVLIGVGILMTGVSDGVATFFWSQWLFTIDAPVITVAIAWWEPSARAGPRLAASWLQPLATFDITATGPPSDDLQQPRSLASALV